MAPKKNLPPSSNSKGLKQGNLFSFFAKKSKDVSSASAVSQQKEESAAAASLTSDTRSNNKASGASLASSTIGASSDASKNQPKAAARSVGKQINNLSKVKKIKIGMKIAVFWPDDRKYYPAIVTKERKCDSAFYLEYEDEEREWIDLRQEKFRFMEDDSDDNSGESEEEEEEEEASGKEQSHRPKKRHRIQEDSDEEEFEMDDAPSKDDGSAYNEDMEEEEGDNDNDDDWMVSDDEDDGISTGSAKKKARKSITPKSSKALKVTKHNPDASPAAISQSANKTPKATARPGSTNTTLTPKSLSDFSAFSTTKNNNAPKRVTPPSSGRSSIASSISNIETENGTNAALPYTQGVVNPAGSHVHNHLKFLENPRDAQGRTKDHPEYDPRTLKIDARELERHNNGKKWSPGVQQWWETKAQYFDTVLLFKTGKFYEMFHMDADIGVQVCKLMYMKGHVAHAGFPETSYGMMADRLCNAGYKVARVEQTETPEMLKERKKHSRGACKVVNREVCSIMTMGTRTYCYLDKQLESDGSESTSGSGPLLVIREVQLEQNKNEEGGDDDTVRPVCEYGIVAVDAARAEITIGQFADDILMNRMTTLLAILAPSEILIEGGDNGASATLHSLLKTAQVTSPHTFRVEKIQPCESFPRSTAIDANIRRRLDRNNGKVHPWDVDETLKELHRRGYFPRGSREQKDQLNTSRWPTVLRAAVEGKAELAISSLGAALYYLQRNLIDEEILSMGLVKAYIPPVSSTAHESFKIYPNLQKNADEADIENENGGDTTGPGLSDVESVNEEERITHMSIDGNTLCQLEILTNSIDHKVDGSLWSRIKFTKTPHGSRLLRAWLLRPLFRKADIDRRADAVEELVSGEAAMAMNEATSVLAKSGDIERLLAKVHSMSGTKFPGADDNDDDLPGCHPNTRAVLYETKTYTKRKVGDFSRVLNGLRSASKIPEIFSNVNVQSGLLKKIVRFSKDGGCFPDISDEIDWFFSVFDFEKAANGEFEPGKGIDPSFDEACNTIEQIHSDLEDYKKEMINNLQPRSLAKSWKYVNTTQDSKDKFTIELPHSVEVPDDFRMVGKRGNGSKQVNKYRSAFIEELVLSLERAIEVHKERKARQMQLIFAKFDAKRTIWAAIAQATALLDALGSLAQVGTKPGYCRPTILDCPPGVSPCIRIQQGRHPCIETTPNSGDFIPNDLSLGGAPEMQKEAPKMVLLLSGPNMGGKSTLLRQTCLITILAQIGGFVPAVSCELTPIDKIFTRLGASDRILLGQSTFFVELAETGAALRGSTRRSLILMDELGRGTSSFDGTAIASACLSYICSNLKCLALFATHYHSLLDEWKNNSKVRLGHMESVVNDDDEDQNNITFLYTLGNGACPKSFGVNVARLARLPEEVLEKAQRISAEFEKEMSGNAAKSRVAPEGAVRQKLELGDLIQNGKLQEVEALWEQFQEN